jgi:tetratricopeptide (TPR) repeat protein
MRPAIQPQPRRLRRQLATLAISLGLLVAARPAGAADPLPPTPQPLLSAPPQRLGPPPDASADAATYQHCMQLAKSDPPAARDLAKHWQDRGGAHPADHCFAVALIGLHEYKEAAGRLETLAQAMVRAPAALRAEVLDQAGQAWLLAGDPARAYAANGAALALLPHDPDIMIDRAAAAGSAGWYDKAVADLDRVLKAYPKRLDALIYRASANRALNRLDQADADIEQALKLSPDSAEALLERGSIRRLRGDIAGARQDWMRVSQLAPGTAEDMAAKANMEHLDGDKPPQPARP